MEAPAPPYLHLLLRQDFSRTCAKARYCFTCERAFCVDCCPLHPDRHHPGQWCRVAQLKVVRDVICIREEDVSGMGYDWRSIQKFKDVASGRRFIPLRRNILPGRLAIYCQNCNDRMYVRSLHCSAACRVQDVPNGGGRGAVTALVNTPFHQQALIDRFCTICCRTYSSSCCINHVAAHHPGQIGSAVRLVRHNGSMFTHAVDLVGFSQQRLSNIQNTMVIFRSEDQLEDEAGNLCANCFKVIGANCCYCCLQCGADDGWAAYSV